MSGGFFEGFTCVGVCVCVCVCDRKKKFIIIYNYIIEGGNIIEREESLGIDKLC